MTKSNVTMRFGELANALLLGAAVMLAQACAAAPPPPASSANSSQTVAPVEAGATWITLGTSGGPQVRVERSQIANALKVGDAIYLFDVGNGVQRQMAMANLPEKQVRAIFLSHHHLDHNADLGPLLMTRWTFGGGPLKVIGPTGTRTLVEGLEQANAPTRLAGFPTGGPAQPTMSTIIAPEDLPLLDEPTVIYQDDKIKVSAIHVDHFQLPPSVPLETLPQAFAFRIDAGGRAIVYSGDTGPSENLIRLARGADVLVTEVVEPEAIAAALLKQMKDASPALLQSIITGMTKNHLTPVEIGRIASEAGVGEVVLTHFVPSPESVTDTGIYAREIGRTYSGPVRLAKDNDSF